jgi:hypothetical protein
MVHVKNIKITEFNFAKEFDNTSNKDMQKFLKYLPKDKAKEILPKKAMYTVSFELHDTCTSIANAIRRTLIDDIEIKSFDFDEYVDINTNDKYLTQDFVKKQIELLPIAQEFDYKDIKISLSKSNNTDEIIKIYARDFNITKNDKQIDNDDIIGVTTPLFPLRPNKYIKINNIFISTGIGIDNAGKYSALNGFTYKIENIQPLQEANQFEQYSGKSSMLVNPKVFSLSYTTHRNIIKPKYFIIKCCETLITRMSNILKDIKNIKNSDNTYKSDLLELETINGLKQLKIKGEYWTVINLISQYCFDETKGKIKFVTPALIHPEKEIGIIKINHPEFSTVMQKSIKKIIDDITTINKAFS